MEGIIGLPEDYNIFCHESGGRVWGLSTGITIIHLPTGTKVSCDSERSQHANRAKCLAEIKQILEQKFDLLHLHSKLF